MTDLLTSFSVEEDIKHWRDDFCHTGEEEHINRANHTIIAVCQALADSPCPVCLDEGFGQIPCTNCGSFPPDRRGKAHKTWQDACDSLGAEIS